MNKSGCPEFGTVLKSINYSVMWISLYLQIVNINGQYDTRITNNDTYIKIILA